ncbi:MAG: DNA polymerase III subunit delta', partial [Luteitalea sp.]|nr:DNA polymerase III subunit delta' [Luteitalea sp.]
MPFRHILGHRRLVALLSRAVERGSLPPSLIFAGPSGVGKRLAALATAQALNCLALRSSTDLGVDACGECSACTRIARGVHPDVLVIEPGDNGSIKIDAVRDIVDRAAYRPFEGRRRAVIIDQADALVPVAQNGLLKTLEEPPPASVFMLVTSRPGVLLDTVRSRCPQLRFRPLGPDDVAAALIGIGQSEGIARATAAIAGGSIGQAFEASRGDLVQARDAASRALVAAAASDDPGRRVESAKHLLVKTGGGGASDREQLATHLRAMASLVRDVELIAVGA